MTLVFLTYLAGVLTIISPCILPVLPFVFARAEGAFLRSTLPLLAGENISAQFVVPTVATSVDLVVHLGIDEHGVRRVNEVVGVPGRVESDVIETEPIFVRHGTELRRTGGLPPRLEQFERRGIDVHGILSGPIDGWSDG